MTPEELEKLAQRFGQTGARIQMADPRVTSTQNWLLAGIGAVLITVGGWTINSINELNKTVVRVAEQIDQSQRTNDAQDRRFDNLDRRMEGFDSRLRETERRGNRQPQN